MHITHPESGVMVTTGIVGSSMPIANGLALAAQIRGEKRVSGGLLRRRRVEHRRLPRGAEHGRGLEAAGDLRVPEQRLCASTRATSSAPRRSGSPTAPRATRCPASRSTATTRWRCTAAAREAVARARAGEGPTLIEAMTFRFQGHVFGDADAYMAPGEKEAAMARDPVPRFRAWLIEGGVRRQRAGRARGRDRPRDRRGGGLRARQPAARRRRTAARRAGRGDRRMSAARLKPQTINTIQAVNMALDEAMGLDPNVILLGEDIADAQEGGIVGVTKGLSTKYGKLARALHADRRAGDHRRGHRRGHRRHAAGGRDHADELHHGGDGHDRQPCRQAALHVGRADARADHDPHDDRRRASAPAASMPTTSRPGSRTPPASRSWRPRRRPTPMG